MSIKYTADRVAQNFAQLSDFEGLSLKNEYSQYVADCLNRISKYEERINQILMHFEVIDSPLSIKIGPEIEFYNIAGEESHDRREALISKAKKLSKEDPSRSVDEILGKDDSFMPKAAQHVNLNKAFFTGLSHARHVEVARETAFNKQTAIESYYPEVGSAAIRSFIAIFQHEIFSPPRSPYGLGTWLAAIGQRIITRAPEFDLIRSEIAAIYNEAVSSSGLHLHISAIGSKDRKQVNILQRDSFPEEKGSKKRNPALLSQLAIHTGYALNHFLRHHIYIFAPTSNSYVRFRHEVSTNRIGFAKRRVRRDQGSAMFRGEGRETFRAEDPGGKPDIGPLRLELRVADTGCIGHPNKVAYQDQIMAPFDVAESLIYVLCKGAERWAIARENELKGQPAGTLTEDALCEQRYALPRWVGDAAAMLKEAQRRGEDFVPRSRAEIITARGYKQQEINDLDHSPHLERGQIVDRNNMLSIIHARDRNEP